MKSSRPLVSVIVPAYNNDKYIGFCLSSLVNQSYDNIEIIVVDDGSTDNTAQIINDYSVQDKRVKILSGKHEGANIARGLGVSEAAGKYYMFVDSDDWLERDAVEILVDKALDTKCDIVRFNAVIEPGRELKNPYISGNARAKKVSGDEARRILTTMSVLNNLCFQFYRADLFKNLESFKKPLSNCEDYLANLEIYGKVNSIVFIKETLYHYRSNYDSTTKNSDVQRLSKNLLEQIEVCATIPRRVSAWGFSRKEQEDVAIATLDKVRAGVFALSKAKGMNKVKFEHELKNVLEGERFGLLLSKVDRNDAKAFVKKQPLQYKLRYGKSLVTLCDKNAVSFWRATSFFRIASRIKDTIKRNVWAKSLCRGRYDGVAKYMRGRLGNQLFQYAAMRQIQEINHDGGEMYLNFAKYIYSLGFKNDLQYFRVRPYAEIMRSPLSISDVVTVVAEKIVKRFYRLVHPRDYRELRYEYEDKRAEALQRRGIYWKEEGALKMQPTTRRGKIAIGHFESARNFDAIRPQLLEELQPIEPPLAKNKKLYNVIEKNESVCISIRRGDFVENPEFAKNYNVCGRKYFKNAVREIKKCVEKPVFVMFSDDIEWCKKNILLPGEKVYYEDGTDPVWEKLRMMYSCKHFVISNSTFSWWAQYLSRNENKVVVAPKKWTNYGYDKDIYEAGWVLVDNTDTEAER